MNKIFKFHPTLYISQQFWNLHCTALYWQLYDNLYKCSCGMTIELGSYSRQNRRVGFKLDGATIYQRNAT